MPVIVKCRLRSPGVRVSLLAKLGRKILQAVGDAGAEVGVELVGDRRIRRLNAQYRQRREVTDVLAFAMREARGPQSNLLGDVVISLPTALRQAKALGHSPDVELATLLIHGILHLCGYDHERGLREARRMQGRERAVWRLIQPLPTVVSGHTDQSRQARKQSLPLIESRSR